MICICDYRTPADVLKSLKGKFEVITLPPDASLPAPVCGHADLLIFKLDNYLITRKNYYHRAKTDIDRICNIAGLELILSDAEAGKKYPLDCGLCAAVSGKNIIFRKASTDGEILRFAEILGYTAINVPQGYSKCSCAVLADGAIITSDRGIASVTAKNGIETLLIRPGHINLPGYDYGFIGGSTGLSCNTLYFTGDLNLHPDADKIKEFSNNHGTECVSLGNGRLYDVGSLIFI